MPIDRRTLLITAAAVAGGVGLGVVAEQRGWWTPAIVGSPDPDVAITRVSRSGEAALIRAYDTALEQVQPLPAATQERLEAYRAHHQDHLAALGGDEGDVAAAPAPGQPDATDPQAEPRVPALPADADALPGYFADLERRHAQLLSTGVRISTGPDQARLLALIVAGETTHEIGWSRG